MRFFASDGKAIKGPSTVAELVASAGFDGDTLVCPVGASDSNDWKPALAYPPFRQALLAPAPKPAPAPIPAPIAAPPPRPAPTIPCPKCKHANPEDARYCNACAARMDGTIEAPPAPAISEPPAPKPEVLELMPSFTAAPFEAPSVSDPAPLAAPPAPQEAAPMRNTLIAAFIGATAASSALGWWLLRPSRHPAPVAHAPAVAAAPAPAAQPAPTAPPAAETKPGPAPEMPMPTAKPISKPGAPIMAETPAPLKARPHRKARAVTPPLPEHESQPPVAEKPTPRKPRPVKKTVVANDGAGESLIESHAPSPAPLAEPAAAPPPAPAAEAARGFILPGIPRRVPKSAVAASEPRNISDEQPLAPPGAAPAGTPPAAPASAKPDDPGAQQVREQFDFCAQLLSQGAYSDHFDTCLCADMRSAAPYRGRRGYYASELKKSASAGRLETRAEIISVSINGDSALVKARWKTSAADAGREVLEHWRPEDGLWCRAP